MQEGLTLETTVEFLQGCACRLTWLIWALNRAHSTKLCP